MVRGPRNPALQYGLRLAAMFFVFAAVLWALGVERGTVLTAASMGFVIVAATGLLVFVDWLRKR